MSPPMSTTLRSPVSTGGIRLRIPPQPAMLGEANPLELYLESLGLEDSVVEHEGVLRLSLPYQQRWLPGDDTLGLHQRLVADVAFDGQTLRRQIVVAMLGGPVVFDFPTLDELLAAVRIRENIVNGARKTALAFKTASAERPDDYWTYAPDTGFTVRPGHNLIAALIKATQPEVSGKLYDFSCYRATEYVILLAVAQELVYSNPALSARLQQQWERKAIMSGQFHDVFLREYGSQEAPLPARYYVPGDRLWFRNPDEASADATGFEGSWVFYLGNGLFSDFWRAGRSYTLESKCLEIYHWRHGLYRDDAGESQINEDIVEARIAETLRNAGEHDRIEALMQRYREPRGVYTEAGGCIDTTREYPRWVCAGTADLVLPNEGG